MKKGIEVWTEYDCEGRWCLKIKKLRENSRLMKLRILQKNMKKIFMQ